MDGHGSCSEPLCNVPVSHVFGFAGLCRCLLMALALWFHLLVVALLGKSSSGYESLEHLSGPRNEPTPVQILLDARVKDMGANHAGGIAVRFAEPPT